jgi:negative regulator of flagellin synthesis FlgM
MIIGFFIYGVIRMKINDTQRVHGLSAYRKNEVKPSGSAKPAARRDEVQISQEAKELLQTGPSEAARLEKLEFLKEKISAGTYRVEDHELAAKLLPYLM